MRPVTMTIDLDGRHVPELVCMGYPAAISGNEHVAATAKAIAKSLGIEEYLGRADRIHELRRTMWEGTTAPHIPAISMVLDTAVLAGAD
jgi:hypothetical protein